MAYNPIAQAMARIVQVAEINEEENESKVLNEELEETQETLNFVKEEEQKYKGCLPSSKQGAVFRIWVHEPGFICARIKTESPPIIVRGGKFQEEVEFDESTGKATWKQRDQEYIMKHTRDLESHLKTAQTKEYLLQKEKDIKAEIADRKAKLKELRKAHEEVLKQEEADLAAANEEEAKAQAATKKKIVAQLDKVSKAMEGLSLEGKSRKEQKAMSIVEKAIEETKDAITETPGSSSSAMEEPEVKKNKTKNKWAKQMADRLVMKRALKSKAGKPMKKVKK